MFRTFGTRTTIYHVSDVKASKTKLYYHYRKVRDTNAANYGDIVGNIKHAIEENNTTYPTQQMMLELNSDGSAHTYQCEANSKEWNLFGNLKLVKKEGVLAW